MVIQAIDKGADSYVQKGGETNAQFAELAHKIRMAVKRRTAEKEESQEFLRRVITNAKEGIIVYDRELQITLWNRLWKTYRCEKLEMCRVKRRSRCFRS